jgi:HD-like signal output (HDOD) protein
MCVSRISGNEVVPPFREHAGALIAQTYDLENRSNQLTRIILKDVGLTSQMLQVANSVLYNRSGRPILTVAHAVTLLGWETVRNLVSTVRYIEHFANRSPGLRELMLLSVLSAVHGRELAVSIGYPLPEEAYLCSLLRNLGEVLIACHYPNEYSQIILAMHAEKVTARVACMRVLDFPWEDVGLRIAATWNLPPSVLLCLSGLESNTGAPADRCLASIADYGHRVTQALYRKGTGIESVHLGSIINPEGCGALVPLVDLQRIIASALSETQQMLAALNIPVNQFRLEQQAERARSILELTPTFNMAELDRAIQSATVTLRSGDFQLTPFIVELLTALQATGFDRAVFGLVNEDCTFIRGRLVAGESSEEIVNLFQFPIDRAAGPISAALQRKVDVLVDRARDDRYDKSALVKAFEASAFALFPIVVDRKVAGCLYADRRERALGLDNVRPSLVRMRDLIGSAIGKKAPPA